MAFQMDVDAFFLEQDQHMDEPEDDMDEFLARMAKTRHLPYLSADDSMDFLAAMTPVNDDQSHVPSNDSIRPPSPKPKEAISGFPLPLSVQISHREYVDEEPQMQPISPIPVRQSARRHTSSPTRTIPQPSIPTISPNHNSKAILKRKESPTKPEKPARKRAAIDASIHPSSPIEVSPAPVKKPPSVKPKSSNKGKLPRLAVKIPPAPVPETIDLSISPIEDAEFSVLVSRFEPEATSTQPKVGLPAKVTANPSFLEMKQRVEKHSAMKREKKIHKGSKLATNVAVGPSKSRPSGRVSGDESSIISVSSSPGPPSPEPNAIRPIKATIKPKPKPTERPKPPPAAKKGKKKEKIKMYPKDYAQMLNDKLSAPPDPAEKPSRQYDQFLKGKNLFYTGGDMTWASERARGRMDLIVNHGGSLFPVFDGALVTHIISDASEGPTLRALGLKSIKDIPDHIPVLKWSWVVAGMDGSDPGPLFEHAAFSNRIPDVEYPAGRGKGKGKQRVLPNASANLSRISDFTQDKKQPKRTIHDSEDDESDQNPADPGYAPMAPSSPPRHKVGVGEPSSSRVKLERNQNDPLAEFYARARAEREDAWTRPGEGDGEDDEDETDVDAASDTDNEGSHNPGPAPKRGFTCDNKEIHLQRKNGPNEFICKKLEALMELHKAKPGAEDRWRAFTYSKALRALRNYHKRITSISEARRIRGIGNKTALKIMEIIETGDLRRIGYENTVDVQVRKIFQGIYGVGQATAFMWYAAGCRSLDDLRAGKGGVTLTDAQKIGIQFYDDINDRMPREEAKALFELIKPIALSIDPKLEIQIMGSYRRGKADCGDIDIMITRRPDDGKTHAGILHYLLKELHERKIITEDLALPENPFDEEAIYRGLCHLPKFGSRRRRIDFLTIPYTSRGAALLYYTGDDIFNRAMRLKANKLGYSLNQKGLFAGVVRDPRNRTIKLNTGNLVASETEEEIFKILSVPFQQPHERVRG
ncbi:DNA polymerase lambda [Mycena vulgaris]|nr:DNA polymerase lambda [Mycena vulgaris]